MNAQVGPPPAPPPRRVLLAYLSNPEHLNALFSFLALVVSIAALIVTTLTLSDQRKVNALQIELNTFERQRQLRVYASRVSMWVQVGEDASSVKPRGLDIQVSNRSPVPVRSATPFVPSVDAAGVHGTLGVDVGDIPPCTEITYRVYARPPQSIRREEQSAAFGVYVVFAETVNVWKLTSHGLEPATASQYRPDQTGTLGVIRLSSTPLADCGEGA
ncbi:hypothetical protein Lfu02_42900 [Longispora fulva]|uniref:Uncharacterized protein n=1 Tax=Longispora fulva TaxID=619741 RepID=A0A8J7GI19_9ACTN|nr:hypothetical protein [Longispora fulva]MBG6136748.1 hypothetical protein [Longispora fulva]GIG59918.1 hypothetical protein Lfu02_42900 [Longispora fulva]